MTDQSTNPLTICLERVGLNSPELRDLVVTNLSGSRQVAAGETILRAGDTSPNVYMMLEGLGARYRMLQAGRQILSFRIPGDFCECQTLASAALDYDVVAIDRCVLAVLPRRELLLLVEKYPPLAFAFLRGTVADHAIERESLLSLGRRRAVPRMAHLFCEMRWRLRAVGIGRGEVFPFPVNQQDLADALGLSLVHVNRCLQQLRCDALLLVRRGAFEVLDADGLQSVADYDDAYPSASIGRDVPFQAYRDHARNGMDVGTPGPIRRESGASHPSGQ